MKNKVLLPILNSEKKKVGVISGSFFNIDKPNIDIYMCYEDNNKLPISNFMKFNIADYDSFIEENIAPYAAQYCGIYYNQQRIGEIDLTVVKPIYTQNRKYRVGLLSDVHYEDGDTGDANPDTINWGGVGQGSESYADLKNILDYFSNKNEIDFIACAGDLTNDNVVHAANLYSLLNKYASTTPLFSCYGNHDYSACHGELGNISFPNMSGVSDNLSRVEHWNNLMFPPNELLNQSPFGGKVTNIQHYKNDPDDIGYATFSFEVPLEGTNKSDIYVFLTNDYNCTNANSEAHYQGFKSNIANKVIKYDTNLAYQVPVTNQYVIIDEGRDGYSSTQAIYAGSGDYTIGFKFTADAQRVLFDFDSLSPYHTHYVTISNVSVKDGNNNDITNNLLRMENPKLGFIWHNHNSLYTLRSGECHSILDNSYEFNSDGTPASGCNSYLRAMYQNGYNMNLYEFLCSSSFSSSYRNAYGTNAVFPITVYMNIQLENDSDAVQKQSTVNTLYEHTCTLLNKSYSYINERDHNQYYDYHFFDPGALLWLENILQSNPNKRVFIFNHLFFSHKTGNNNALKYYNYAADGWRITPYTSTVHAAYCLCGIQFEFLNALNNTYKKSIWFTGHSHYKWNWQQIDKTINVSNKEYDYLSPDDLPWESLINTSNDGARYLRNYTEIANLSSPWYEAFFESQLINIGYGVYYNLQNLTPNKHYILTVDAYASYTNLNILPSLPSNIGHDSVVAKLEIQEKTSGKIIVSRNVRLNVGEKIHDYNPFIIDFIPHDNEVYVYLTAIVEAANWFTMRLTKLIDADNQQYDLRSYELKGVRINKSYIKIVPYDNVLPQNKQEPSIIGTTGYNIHLPSAVRPLTMYRDSYGCTDVDSEGAIMDVYDDYIEIRGVIFKENKTYGNQYINKYLPMAQYRIPVAAG